MDEDAEELWETFGRRGIYNSRHPTERVRLTREQVMELVEDDPIMSFYDRNGTELSRKVPETIVGDRGCAIFFNLPEVHRIFKNDQRPELPPSVWRPTLEEYEEGKVQVFPLALTRTIGNVQASVPACVVQDEIERVNIALRRDNAREGDRSQRTKYITGHTSNYYNTVAHAIRDSNSAFDCAKGDLTKELAGSHAIDVKSRNECNRLRQRHADALPTTRLRSKLSDNNPDATSVPRAARLETVVSIDIAALKAEHRTGR